MSHPNDSNRFWIVGDGSGLAPGDSFHKEEVQLALRNKGMPLEGLRYPITPTGMHYLLVHFDIPNVNVREWRLRVEGLLSNPLSLSLNDIKARPAITITVTMECAGNGRALLTPRPISHPWLVGAVGTAEWTGVPLRGLLDEAGLRDDATEIVFSGSDRGVEGGHVHAFERSLSRDEACRNDVILAYEMNGRALPPQHGYPLRLIVPDWYGMASVKWLERIESRSEPFPGYQMTQSYRYANDADDPGEPVTLIRVRALMAPPGIPDFLTRARLVPAGPITLSGRAWAGRAGVTRVDVSTDDGVTWSPAHLDGPLSPFAWRAWSFHWDALPCHHTLSVRPTDRQGDVQPLAPRWNFQGMGNNAVQRVAVVVE